MLFMRFSREDQFTGDGVSRTDSNKNRTGLIKLFCLFTVQLKKAFIFIATAYEAFL